MARKRNLEDMVVGRLVPNLEASKGNGISEVGPSLMDPKAVEIEIKCSPERKKRCKISQNKTDFQSRLLDKIILAKYRPHIPWDNPSQSDN